MKLTKFFVLALLPASALTWGPFKSTPEIDAPSTRETKTPDFIPIYGSDNPLDTSRSLPVPSNFNSKELLDSMSRKSEIYTEALQRLKRLEDEPVCHRVAAQLLMNNCRGLEDVNEQVYQVNSDHLQRHHVESFTASLTICEMERSALVIPEACSSFTSSSLFRHTRESNGKLEVTPTEVGDCMKALHHDQSSLTLWVSYRNSALMFCRAARLDLDKDQYIFLHNELAQNMENLSNAVHEDLEIIRQKMADNTRAAESYWEKFAGSAQDFKLKLQHALQSILKDVTDVKSATSSVLKHTNTAAHMTNRLVQSMYESIAEVSAKQETALASSTAHINTQMDAINQYVVAAEERLMHVTEIIEDSLYPMIGSLVARQDALEEKSLAALSAMENATAILESHILKLNQATVTASGINENLERVVEAAQSWSDTLSAGGSLPDWTLRTWIPMGFLVIGNFGHAASWTFNAKLAATGLIAGEAIIVVRRLYRSNLFQLACSTLSLSYPKVSALTHKAREQRLSPLAETPVDFPLPPISTQAASRPDVV